MEAGADVILVHSKLSTPDEIERYVKRKDFQVYAENVFNEISSKITLRLLYFAEEICMGIDTKEDLETVRGLFRPS